MYTYYSCLSQDYRRPCAGPGPVAGCLDPDLKSFPGSVNTHSKILKN